jgi:DNA-binding XRE family transcriptional regulator
MTRLTTADSSPGLSQPLRTVRQARILRGRTQDELAAKAGVTAGTIYAIEVKGTNPHRATRRVIAAALGCDPRELACNINKHAKHAPTPKGFLDDEDATTPTAPDRRGDDAVPSCDAQASSRRAEGEPR